jgi:hypothetical protein
VNAAATLSEQLSAGKTVIRSAIPPVARGKASPQQQQVRLTDEEIDSAVKWCNQGTWNITDPEFGIVRELALEGGRLIKAHRRGARQPRKKSEDVTRRLEVVLQACRELPPKRKKTLTGTMTLDAIRRSVIEKLGLDDDDNVISEDTIKKDMQQIRGLLRLVEKEIIPRTGRPGRHGISEQTRKEMEEGKKALAKAAARKPHGRTPS